MQKRYNASLRWVGRRVVRAPGFNQKTLYVICNYTQNFLVHFRMNRQRQNFIAQFFRDRQSQIRARRIPQMPPDDKAERDNKSLPEFLFRPNTFVTHSVFRF